MGQTILQKIVKIVDLTNLRIFSHRPLQILQKVSLFVMSITTQQLRGAVEFTKFNLRMFELAASLKDEACPNYIKARKINL